MKNKKQSLPEGTGVRIIKADGTVKDTADPYLLNRKYPDVTVDLFIFFHQVTCLII